MNPSTIYRTAQNDTVSGRDVEIRVIEKATGRLVHALSLAEGTDRNRSLDSAVQFNLRVWDVLHADWDSHECPLEISLRSDLLRLSVYVHKTSIELLAYGSPEKAQSLIHINTCLVAGLKTATQQS